MSIRQDGTGPRGGAPPGPTGGSDAVTAGLAQLSALERDLCGAALRSFGVTAGQLSEREQAQLDADGFTILPGVLSPAEIAAMNARLDEAITVARDLCGTDPRRNPFPRYAAFEDDEIVLKDLVNWGPEFDIAISHPRVLAAVQAVLGDNLKLSYLHMRQPAPGAGHQDLHLDTYEDPAVHPVHYFCNTIWMLDDFTEESGPTRFVPGSHRRGVDPGTAMGDAYADHPDQVLATGPAGSVIVFDGHVWHGGTRNRSGARRRGLFSAWVHRGSYPIEDQRKMLRPDTYARLDDPRRFLLDVHGALPLEPPDMFVRYSID
ncbi:MAG: phytanoyl-CoA dioxygenase family protein [Streptosporangiaceae bacterium]